MGSLIENTPLLAVHARSSGLKWRLVTRLLGTGLVRAPLGLLKRATVDRVLRASGLDYARVTRPVAAVRFQAKRSNELWQFDMSPSDLKQVEAPLWIERSRGKPTLMLFSVVDFTRAVAFRQQITSQSADNRRGLRFRHFNTGSAVISVGGRPRSLPTHHGPARFAVYWRLVRAAESDPVSRPTADRGAQAEAGAVCTAVPGVMAGADAATTLTPPELVRQPMDGAV
jgi:hypothetical protein